MKNRYPLLTFKLICFILTNKTWKQIYLIRNDNIVLISGLCFICFLFSRRIRLAPIFVTLGKQKAFSSPSNRRSILAYFHRIMKTTLVSQPIVDRFRSREPMVELRGRFQGAVPDTWMQVAILKPGGCCLSLEWASPQVYIGQRVTLFNAGLSLPCQSSHWNIYFSIFYNQLWSRRTGLLKEKSWDAEKFRDSFIWSVFHLFAPVGQYSYNCVYSFVCAWSGCIRDS